MKSDWKILKEAVDFTNTQLGGALDARISPLFHLTNQLRAQLHRYWLSECAIIFEMKGIIDMDALSAAQPELAEQVRTIRAKLLDAELLSPGDIESTEGHYVETPTMCEFYKQYKWERLWEDAFRSMDHDTWEKAQEVIREYEHSKAKKWDQQQTKMKKVLHLEGAQV